jgi:hypothetical protein
VISFGQRDSRFLTRASIAQAMLFKQQSSNMKRQPQNEKPSDSNLTLAQNKKPSDSNLFGVMEKASMVSMNIIK